jgi:hypothetical protein
MKYPKKLRREKQRELLGTKPSLSGKVPSILISISSKHRRAVNVKYKLKRQRKMFWKLSEFLRLFIHTVFYYPSWGKLKLVRQSLLILLIIHIVTQVKVVFPEEQHMLLTGKFKFQKLTARGENLAQHDTIFIGQGYTLLKKIKYSLRQDKKKDNFTKGGKVKRND